MTDPNKLKTKRERIIHNEKVKHMAATTGNLAIAGGLGIFVSTAFILLHLEKSLMWQLLVCAFALAGALFAFWGVGIGKKMLEDLVDPEDLPKSKTKRKSN